MPIDNANDPVAPTPRRMERLKKRRDFLLAAKARKWSTPGFVLQARPRGDDAAPRLGLTASKKVGGAVARNRAKRRLRALGQGVGAALARPGWDYVLIARAGSTATRSFLALRTDLEQAMERVHREPKDGRERERAASRSAARRSAR